jgi:hypothetical protein
MGVCDVGALVLRVADERSSGSIVEEDVAFAVAAPSEILAAILQSCTLLGTVTATEFVVFWVEILEVE